MNIKRNDNFVLVACVAVLALLCFMSVYSPIRFERQQAEREHAVKERLVSIRQAEETFRQRHGRYAATFKELLDEQLITKAETLVPYTDDEQFELSATTLIGKSGRAVPLMECGAQYQQYLNGLDENAIANLIEAANESGRYPGLRIGNLSTPNNNAGNWE